MKSFNLTEWSLRNKELVYFLIALTFIAGIFSYQKLGRMEDPDFTIRTMVVSVSWPGASAREVEEQVTDKIEKKLQDLPGLDYLKSYSKPEQSLIYVNLKETSVKEAQVRPLWLEARNLVNDVKGSLPSGVVGPFFNDRFDDVFGNVYALTGDGYNYEELREQAEKIRRTLIRIHNVKKVELIGEQTEKIYVEIETIKLAQLGMSPTDITSAIQAQNAMTPSGMLETSTDNVYLRVSGMFERIEDLKSLPIRAGGRTFRLADIAKVERSFVEPMEGKFFFNGQPAIGIAVSMERGGNILDLGESLKSQIERWQKELPAGMELHTVFNQPKVVESSISEFTKSLAEAIAIVLLVSFVSLGLRSGLVVAFCIPLVIAAVFAVMKIIHIDLHNISLGALIISLGLLVDDAIIAIEMMSVKLEQGWNRFDAACHAYTVTAFPMLTGTLITCAGFIPVGFAPGVAAEYVGSMFYVILISLVISWVVAAVATPLFGYHLIRTPQHEAKSHHDMYNTPFYRKFKTILTSCLRQRKMVLIGTLVCFVLSIGLMGLVREEFFPESTHMEVIVDLRLPAGASMQASEAEVKRFAQQFEDDPHVDSLSLYVGEGAPRFVLTVNPADPMANFSQLVISAKNLAARKAVIEKAQNLLTTEFPAVQGNVKMINSGPSEPYGVMIRVSGPDHHKLRIIAEQVRERMAANPDLINVNLDWNEKSKLVRLDMDRDKARMLGLNNQAVAQNLQAFLSGTTVGEFRERDKTVSINFRVDAAWREDLSRLKDLNIHLGNGKYIPLEQVATIKSEMEDGLIWRRNLVPTITAQANAIPGIAADSAAKAFFETLGDLREKLPPGYNIVLGGTAESSVNAAAWLLEPVPVMLILILVLLMLQLGSVSKTILVLLTAPLGLIGVSIGLLLTGRPMGFVVQLGILALSGIIMRNSVILIDQIEKHLADGEDAWDAIINATISRFRPILLTAAAAILAMIPLVSSLFWGPMAVAIAAGLFGATILTLIVLPVMYAAWFKVQPATEQ
jgi:multidrug efflux pump subunit AcrB